MTTVVVICCIHVAVKYILFGLNSNFVLIGSDDFQGQGNSFFGRGGRGNKKAQMRHCLRLMRSMVSTAENVVLQDFVDQGAVHQLTGKKVIIHQMTHLQLCRKIVTFEDVLNDLFRNSQYYV